MPAIQATGPMAAIPYLSFCSFGSMDCAVGNCRGMPIQAPIDKLGREKGCDNQRSYTGYG